MVSIRYQLIVAKGIGIVDLQNCLDFLSKYTGIKFDSQNEAAVCTRIKELRLSSAAHYLDYLRSEVNIEREIRILAPKITVGETYFLRDIGQLEVLATFAKQLVSPKAQSYLRVWSAGCSTGEEAYSVAILLEELRSSGHKFAYSIFASDIDDARLEIAKKGVYSGRSVKNVPLKYLQKYFVEQGGLYTVGDRIKPHVTFAYCNLVTGSPLKLTAGYPCFDIILCRNVFIYFDKATIVHIAEKFYQLLSAQGALFLGYSETLQFMNTQFQIHPVANRYCYVRDNQGIIPILSVLPPTRRLDKSTVITMLETRKMRNKMEKRRRVSLETASANEVLTIVDASKAYKTGNYSAAMRICQKLLTQDSLNAKVYDLVYRICMNSGKHCLAIATIRKLLFLEPGNLSARYNLARALEQVKNIDKSVLEYKNILAAINGKDATELVPDGDGLTYGLLKQICKAKIRC